MAKHKRSHNKGISVTTTLLLVSFIVTGALCITKIHNNKNQLKRLKEEKELLALEEEALQDKLKAIQNLYDTDNKTAQIIALAHKNLDMVFDNEIIFKDKTHPKTLE